MSAPRLPELWRCFQGVIPSVVATSDANGIPNVTYVSQIFLIDESHVALSCQFFNKTRRNLDVNPRVCIELYDPVNFDAYRLRCRFLRSEKSGPLFETMSTRIEAIASHTGMSGVFRLIAADVLEVEAVEKVEGFRIASDEEDDPAESVGLIGFRSELRGLQLVSERINRASDLDSLLQGVLDALEQYFGFSYTMVLMHEESCGRLVTIASRGYGESGIGAEVAIGSGLIGSAAQQRRVLRFANIDAELRYSRAVRREAERDGETLREEIPLPGLRDARSMLLMPLSLCDRLLGVLAAESRDPIAFAEWHEAYLEIIGNQIALGIDRMTGSEDEVVESAPRAAAPVLTTSRKRTLTFYASDDCVFIDDEYLIRNVPGRILWKLVNEWKRCGRTEFSNRELRLDPSLGLPAVKDNLESRLILLRKRLEEKCPDIRLAPVGRGRFELKLQSQVELIEK